MWKLFGVVVVALVVGYFIGVYWPSIGNKVAGK